jgi:ABC-2 type transport system permease protein
MLLFMLLPLAIPVTIASYSIVGEKATRTLEPVLATPVSTLELLSGKAIAAVVPAVLATWLGFTIFALGTMLISESVKITGRLLDPVWLIAVFVLGPLLAIAAVNVAVMVSSRATDPRVAEQLSMLVVLPLLAVFFGQVTGLILINETLILWMTLAMIVVDTVTFLIAVRLFQRETILTRWK